MKLRQTAIHEAGHAVIEYALGLSCSGVTIIYDKKKHRYGTTESPNPAYGYYFDNERERKMTMRKGVIGCCAGLAAEHVFFGVPLDIDNDNAQGDFQNIIKLERQGLVTSRGGYVGDDGTWRFISRVLREAKKLVLLHHDTIEQLSNVLVEKKKLNGKEVEEFLHERIER